MKKWTIEITWIIINALLVAKYFFDQMSIRCEPCPPDCYCPPCQTTFMSQFWIYMTIFNALIVLVSIIKLRRLPGK